MHVLEGMLLACSFILQAKLIEMKIDFNSTMFPDLDPYVPINSSAIQISWKPSPTIANIDLTQLTGTYNISVYVGYRPMTYGINIPFSMTQLNETGKTILTGLQANTIYTIRSQKAWQDNGIMNSYITSSFPKLVRTYAIGE